MHSGARRHITIDFGKPVLLTDIFIPSCSDLVTVTIDIWLKGEDIDETRLVVAMDIGSRNLLLTDLQHPPLCRFMKVNSSTYLLLFNYCNLIVFSLFISLKMFYYHFNFVGTFK